MKQHFSRLDEVAGKLNIWLFVIAIGLAVLDFSVLIFKSVEALPPPAAESNAASSPAHIAGLSSRSADIASRSPSPSRSAADPL
jgi:hypothetical protein